MVVGWQLLALEGVLTVEAEVVVRHEAVGVGEWVLAGGWQHGAVVVGVLLVGHQVLLLHFEGVR